MTKEEKREYDRKRYLEKRDEILAYHKKYYQENKVEIIEYQKKYNEENYEKVSERKKKHRKENHDKYKEYDKLRYEREKDEMLQDAKERYQENKEEIKERVRKRDIEYAKYDTYFEKLCPYYSEDELRRDPDNGDLIQVRCKLFSCRKWFNPTNREVRHRLEVINGTGTGSCDFYCSEDCKKNCPNFRKKLYPAGFKSNDDLSREVQSDLRDLVLARDNYTCQREGCHKSKKDFPDLILHCHHIKPLNEDPVCSADIDNCITYCEECHRWVHMNVPGCSYTDLRC